MTLQPFQSRNGVVVIGHSLAAFKFSTGDSDRTMDAAGESVTMIGELYLSTGIGTSKTISSAGGGKIFFAPRLATFANASTNLRVGIQDVNPTTGLEDGTFDVYGDLVGGTDTITAAAVNSAAMDSGTKTIAHGDIVAVSIEMTARGGADSITITTGSPSVWRPYVTIDTGSGPTKIASVVNRGLTVMFDDGTLGWFGFQSFCYYTSSIGYNTNSTPDEYGIIFQLPFKAAITSIVIGHGNPAASRTFDVFIYSDPLGTPTVIETITPDTDIGSNGAWMELPLANLWEPDINTDYAITMRPTTTSTLDLQRLSFGSGNDALRGATMLGTNWRQGSRDSQTGAFTEDTTFIPLIGFRLSQLDDGAGGGAAGTTAHVF